MYTPACSIQRLAELQTPGTGRRQLQAPGTMRREAGGVRWVVFGGRYVACSVLCGRWRAVYGGRNHDIGGYHGLNFIFSAATVTRSHDASWSRY